MISEDKAILTKDVPNDDGVVRLLTINRPAKRNAMNTEMISRLLSDLLQADEEPTIGAIVITGAGGHFSAGGDTGEFVARDTVSAKMNRARLLGELLLRSRRLATPVVAAIRGIAVGGGAALALSADMTLAGEDLKFGFPELVNGVLPTAVMVGLAKQLGSRYAFELLSSGRLIDATEAMDRGIVNHIVSGDETVDGAIEIAQSLASVDPTMMRRMKRQFYTVQELPDSMAMDSGLDLLENIWSNTDQP